MINVLVKTEPSRYVVLISEYPEFEAVFPKNMSPNLMLRRTLEQFNSFVDLETPFKLAFANVFPELGL